MNNTNNKGKRWFRPIERSGHFLLLMIGVNCLIIFSFFSYNSYSAKQLEQKELQVFRACEENCKSDKKILSNKKAETSVADFCRFRCDSTFALGGQSSALQSFMYFVMFFMINATILALYGGLVKFLYNRRSGTVLVVLGSVVFFMMYQLFKTF